MGRKVFSVTLKKDRPDQRWGFGITGGKDVGLTIRIEKVSPSSPASAAGLHNLDYLVKVGNQEVFDMNHNEVVSMVRSAGSQLDIVVERYGLLCNETYCCCILSQDCLTFYKYFLLKGVPPKMSYPKI